MRNRRDPPFFFDEGIRFECLRCGFCCTGEPGTIFITGDEVARAAQFLNLTIETFLNRYCYPFRSGFSIREHPDGRCVFFDEGCRIYPVRPRQCRTYPFWLNNLRSEKRWRSVMAECPGIGRGRRYDKEEILSRIHESMRDR